MKHRLSVVSLLSIGLASVGLIALDSRAQGKPAEPKIHGTVSVQEISQAEYPKLAKLGMSEAGKIAAAKTGGNVISVGLENEDGYLVYAVETSGGASGRNEVLVDAGSGKILGIEKKGPHDRHGENEADEQDED